MQQVREQEIKQVTKDAFRMALGTLSSRVLGLARDIILAAFFSRVVTDAFVVAFRLPNFFRRILGEGSIGSAFTPLYVGARGGAVVGPELGAPPGELRVSSRELRVPSRELRAPPRPSPAPAGETPGGARSSREGTSREQQGYLFARTVFIFLLSLSLTLSVLGIVFMKPILQLLVSGHEYLAITGKFELTLWLARLMFLYFFLVTSYAFLSALSQAHGRFFWPAVAPAFFNVAIICAAFLPPFSANGDQLAFGVLAGGALQNLIVIITSWPIVRALFARRTGPGTSSPVSSLKPFLIRLSQAILGLGGAQVIALINIYFGARLPAGSLTYVYFADRLLELPLSLVAVSLGSALLPTLAALWQQKNHAHYASTLTRQIEVLLFLVLPSALGLGLLARPILTALFLRGEFQNADVETTARVLCINAGILIFIALTRIFVVASQSAGQTRAPALISLVGAGVHFVIALALTRALGLVGLMYATLISSVFVSAMNAMVFTRLLLQAGEARAVILPLARFTLRLCPGLLVLAVTALLVSTNLGAYRNSIVGVGLTILLAAGIYMLVSKKMGVTRHLGF